MTILKSSTKRGACVLERGQNCTATSLDQLYGSYSIAKQRAFDWCWEQFCKDENASNFGVGNANTFGFTASWYTMYEGNIAMRVETKDNSYLVIINHLT